MAESNRRERIAVLRRWLRPGVGVKRWLVVVFLGLGAFALAGALVLRQLYRGLGNGPGEPILDTLTLQFLPLPIRVAVLVAVGAALFLLGFWRLVNLLLEPFSRPEGPLVELIYQRRSLARGPRIVAIGGGHGLSTLLRGLKQFSSNITAVVTVADDGGSSGKLREELGITPMGDIRRCIAALADDESVMTKLLQYRFPVAGSGNGRDGEAEKAQEPGEALQSVAGIDTRQPGVSGHAFGNLLIAALSAIEGDFEEGVRQSNRVLAVRGAVVPVAPGPLTLHAELDDGSTIQGQSLITRSRGIRRVWIVPERARASAEAVRAIAAADLVVLGPGSLFTSVLPALLVPEIRTALLASSAVRVYACNVATQVGETDGFTLGDHLRAFAAHKADELVDVVLANDNFDARVPADYPAGPVRLDDMPSLSRPHTLVLRDIVDDAHAHQHDPAKLAGALLEVLADSSPVRSARLVRSA
jgi:uncharacterized cofD-like protein